MMLMAGTDEIGYVLAKDAEIAAWEDAHPPAGRHPDRDGARRLTGAADERTADVEIARRASPRRRPSRSSPILAA